MIQHFRGEIPHSSERQSLQRESADLPRCCLTRLAFAPLSSGISGCVYFFNSRCVLFLIHFTTICPVPFCSCPLCLSLPPPRFGSRLFHCIKPGSVPFPTVLLQFVPLARNQIQFSLIPLVWIFCSDAPLTSFPHRRQYNKCTVSIHLLKITFPITYNSPWVLFFFELSVACVVCHNQFEMKR